MTDTGKKPVVPGEKRVLPPLHFLAVFTAAILLLFIASFLSVDKYNKHVKNHAFSELGSIADLKVAQLNTWLQHHQVAAQTMFEDREFADTLSRKLQNPQGAQVTDRATKLFKYLNENYGDTIAGYGMDGQALFSYPGGAAGDFAGHKKEIDEAVRNRKVVFADFHRHGPDAKITLSFVIPVFPAGRAGPAAIVFLITDPSRDLYPLIQSWPTASASAETLLFRQENDQVLYLNELRHRKGTPLSFGIPLTQKDVIAVQALALGEGIFEGVDYRGIASIAAVRKVPGIPWMMVSKVDEKEIFGQLNNFNKAAYAAMLVSVLLCFSGLLYSWKRYQETSLKASNQQLRAVNQQLTAAEQQLRAYNLQLKASEERFRSLIESAPEGIFVHCEGKFVFLNPAMVALLGASREEELLGTDFMLRMAPEYHDAIRERMAQRLQTGRSSEPMEQEYVRMDGVRVPVETTAMPISFQGRDAHLMFVRDVTRRVQMQNALLRANERLRKFVDANIVGVVIADRSGKMIEANDYYLDLIGYSRAEFEKGMADGRGIMPLERLAADEECIRELREKGACRSYEKEFVRRDGTRVAVLLVVTLLPGRDEAIAAFALDISERKKAEEELRESKAKLEAVIGSMADAVFVTDTEGNYVENNASFFKYYRFGDKDRALRKFEQYKEYVDVFYPDGTPAPPDRWPVPRALRGDKVSNEELILRKKDTGETWWGSYSFAPVTDSSGKIVGAVVAARDITESKGRDEHTRVLSGILDEAPAGVVIVGSGGRVLYANKHAALIHGYAPDEFRRRDLYDLVAPENRSMIDTRIKAIEESGDAVFEVTHVKKDGTPLPLLVRAGRIKWRGETAVLSVQTDLTEHKHLEEESIRSHKLDSLGVLAGGIAHDFNNILTGILGNISLVRHALGPSDASREVLTEAEKAVFQAKSLTMQLLTFSKGGVPVKQPTAVAGLIEETALFATRGSNVKRNFAISKDLCLVNADQGQIAQVISNIVINAVQAMPEGGELFVGAENTTITGSENVPLEPGRYVRITFRDTGTGIDKEHLGRIFDPYFTTKQTGNGLGLAASYSIMKNHGGYIAVESEAGKGSVFSVYIPALAGTCGEDRQAEEKKAQSGRGRVLVLDDEAAILRLMKRTLASLGYEAECFENADQLVERYRQALGTPEAFDAVVLDLTIPGGKGGKEVIGMLQGIDPRVKAVVSSGYSNDAVVAAYRQYGFSATLSKPYTIEEVSEVLSRLLDATA